MTITMGLAEAKMNFLRVTAKVNRTGTPVTVLKNNKPWVVIAPVERGAALRVPPRPGEVPLRHAWHGGRVDLL